MTGTLEQDLGWDSRPWGHVCSTVCYRSRSSYNIIKATTAFTFTHTSKHSHLHWFCHPPDPPNASAAGPTATAAGPSPGEGANASMVLQTKTAGTQNITPRPTYRQTRGCKEQKMSKQMKWTGNKNERSASGKSREYKKYAARLLQRSFWSDHKSHNEFQRAA